MTQDFINFNNNDKDFFEGFKTPTSYFMIGNLDIEHLNMDEFNSNLLIIPKEKSEDLIKKIKNNFESINESEGFSSLITKVEKENYIMLMTFIDVNNDNGLHETLSLKDSIQLLDDTTSTNDCVRALSYLHELKEYNSLTDEQFLEIEKFIKSQLSVQGWETISQFAPELLEANEIKVRKLKL